MLLSAVAEGDSEDFELGLAESIHLGNDLSWWTIKSGHIQVTCLSVHVGMMAMPGTGSGAPHSLSPHPDWDMAPLMLSSYPDLR